MVIKQRLPTDFTTALNVMIPGSGDHHRGSRIRPHHALVQYVNLQSGYAAWRVESLLGAGVGDKRGGLCVTSQ